MVGFTIHVLVREFADLFDKRIEYDIIGEGSQISTNQKPGNRPFLLLIG